MGLIPNYSMSLYFILLRYLPVLLNSHPTTRSPLLLAFHNGLFNAVIIDGIKFKL
jgi:hypothetical protein